MTKPARKTDRSNRTGEGETGLSRFVVLGRETDRDLVRSLALRLAEDGPDASRLREAIGRMQAPQSPTTGGILATLRRSPLVGADLDLRRSSDGGRTVDL